MHSTKLSKWIANGDLWFANLNPAITHVVFQAASQAYMTSTRIPLLGRS